MIQDQVREWMYMIGPTYFHDECLPNARAVKEMATGAVPARA